MDLEMAKITTTLEISASTIIKNLAQRESGKVLVG